MGFDSISCALPTRSWRSGEDEEEDWSCRGRRYGGWGSLIVGRGWIKRQALYIDRVFAKWTKRKIAYRT